jgi:gamma-glutamylcyclotransferase (GGCT)/AIG2-like uncharacterized protein YtfP
MIGIFVYGTLKPEAVNYRVCERFVVDFCPAIAYGKLYALPFGYPVMTKGNQPIYGYRLRVTDATALTVLDDFEQHDPLTFQQHMPHLGIAENQYERQLIEVWSDRNQPLGQAWAYLMTPTQVTYLGGVPLPDGYWEQNDQGERQTLFG